MSTNNEAPTPASEGATKNHSAGSIPHPARDSKPDLLNEALEGLRRGWDFTPLNGKKPILKGWQNRPRATGADLIRWVEAGHNLGLLTGKASGLIVIDIDEQKGGRRPDGLPDTVEVLTGGGGRHLYYQTPEGVKNSVGELAAHVDVRSDGGQVVFVGSVPPDPGLPYRWAPGCSPDEGV